MRGSCTVHDFFGKSVVSRMFHAISMYKIYGCTYNSANPYIPYSQLCCNNTLMILCLLAMNLFSKCTGVRDNPYIMISNASHPNYFFERCPRVCARARSKSLVKQISRKALNTQLHTSLTMITIEPKFEPVEQSSTIALLEDTCPFLNLERPPAQILFLDFDGVLNDHERMPNGYHTIKTECAIVLNRLLKSLPMLKIIITSAWRYPLQKPEITEYLMLTHGIHAQGRVIGHTQLDEVFHQGPKPPLSDTEWWAAHGIKWRVDQIRLELKKLIREHPKLKWAVLDDLPLPIENLVQTHPSFGLTDPDLPKLMELLA